MRRRANPCPPEPQRFVPGGTMPQSAAKSSSAAQSGAKAKRSPRARRPEVELDAVELLSVLRAFRRGDFSVRLPRGLSGVGGDIAEAFNDVVELNDRMTK